LTVEEGFPSLAELKRSQLYSEQLEIELAHSNEAECFKWFLASLLFGGRISETIARHTYQAFQAYGLLTPRRILNAGWDHLVSRVMREGGYVRYDERKSTQVLRDCETLIADYDGSLFKLHQEARDSVDLEKRLLAFYGVGPVTVNIFLRELRPYWQKADPAPLPVVAAAAERLGLDLGRFRHNTVTFTRIEAGLIRLRKQLRSRST
jgi:endonuclease III